MSENAGRGAFFESVYRQAEGDAGLVPWADLKPKPQLVDWLAARRGAGVRAIDIACGLGDNAEAIAAAGYDVTAFDLSADAIEWAKKRFANSSVKYGVADLLAPPAEWAGGFDLVHECYTLQAVPPAMLEAMTQGVARLAAPGGTLLVYTRIRPDDAPVDGPPWPLQEREAMAFASLGFELVSVERFANMRGEREIPHLFCEWRKA